MDIIYSYPMNKMVGGNPCGVASGRCTSSENPSSHSNTGSKTGTSTALQVDLNKRIEIYPNPADRYLNIVLSEGYDHMASLELRDINGNLVHKSTDIPSNTHLVDVHHLNNGVYVLNMKQRSDLIITRENIIY